MIYWSKIFRINSMLVACFVAFSASGATIPKLKYQTTGGADNRKLIFLNNPEEIRYEDGICDLADPSWIGDARCFNSLLKLDKTLGSYRLWFEHSNKTNQAIHFGVLATNKSSHKAKLNIRGASLVGDAIKSGGMEFVEMFNNYSSSEYLLQPSEKKWLLVSTQANKIAAGAYFSGVVDFDVKLAPISIEVVAFINEVAPNLNDGTYNTRVVGRVHESLVYKGTSEHSEAEAKNVDFTIDDSDLVGRLKVAYSLYQMPQQSSPPKYEGVCRIGNKPLCSGDRGYFSSHLVVRDNWITHIAPDPYDSNSKRSLAVVSDIISLYMPSLPLSCKVDGMMGGRFGCFEISPFYKWYYHDFQAWKYPNWGNWGVHYKIGGKIKNVGTKTRRLQLAFRADGHTPIAYRGMDNVWRQAIIKKPLSSSAEYDFSYSTIEVLPDTIVHYRGETILSGPGTGTFEEFVKIVQ